MTVKELKKFFEDHLVPSRLYHMKGGHHKNRICIAKNKAKQDSENKDPHDKNDNGSSEGSAANSSSPVKGVCVISQRSVVSAVSAALLPPLRRSLPIQSKIQLFRKQPSDSYPSFLMDRLQKVRRLTADTAS